MSTQPTSVWLSIGGNLGDVPASFTGALTQLDLHPEIKVITSSSLYETEPVGDAATTPFLNAALELETTLRPLALLTVLHQIEQNLGRERTQHWGSRTLDLDIILYGSEIIQTPQLTIPHSAAWYRRFVLDPLAENAGEVSHPVKQATIQELRDHFAQRPFQVAFLGDNSEPLQQMVLEEFPQVFLSESKQTEELSLLVVTNKNPPPEPCMPLLDLSSIPEAEQPEFLKAVLTAALDVPRSVDQKL